jgi:hypothetical protein
VGIEPTESGLDELVEQTRYVYPDYESGVCVYCGETADTVDHLLPKPWTGGTARKYVPVVPACRECNSTLGAIFLPDVQERRTEVHRRYRRKYRRALSMVVLHDDALDDFGPNIRLTVVRLHEEHYRALRRLSWPVDPSYDAEAWEHAWTP